MQYSEYQHVHSAVRRVPYFYAVYFTGCDSQFSVLIRQKMQSTGWDNVN